VGRGDSDTQDADSKEWNRHESLSFLRLVWLAQGKHPEIGGIRFNDRS